MGTTNFEASLPSLLPKQIEAMQAEIAELTEKRRQAGLFINVKAEEAKIEEAKAKAEEIRRGAEEKAAEIINKAYADAEDIKTKAINAAEAVKVQAVNQLSKVQASSKKLQDFEASLNAREAALEPKEAALQERADKLSAMKAEIDVKAQDLIIKLAVFKES